MWDSSSSWSKFAVLHLSVVSSCKQALQEELGREDGDYSMVINPKCKRAVKVYCYGMNTPDPKEYITLAQGSDNHARIYHLKLRQSKRNQCGGIDPGSEPYNEGGFTRFYKVRFDIASSKIVPTDFRFASSSNENSVPYGTAGDCYSSNNGNCRKGSLHKYCGHIYHLTYTWCFNSYSLGSFSIDLRGTGLKLRSPAIWTLVARPAGIRIQDFQVRNNSQVISAKCGGYCGKCRPKDDVILEQLHCGKSCIIKKRQGLA